MERQSKIRKRKYSRKGCKECKRRKIKCDEGYPACHNCSRLNKKCIYVSKNINHTQIDDSDVPNSNVSETNFKLFSEPKSQWTLEVRDGPGIPLNVEFYVPNATNKRSKKRNVAEKPTHPRQSDRGVQGGILESTPWHNCSAASPHIAKNDDFIGSEPLRQDQEVLATNSISAFPSGNDLTLRELDSTDMRNLLDEASGLVSDINHLLDLGVVESYGGYMKPADVTKNVNDPENHILNSGRSVSPVSSANSDELHYFHIDEFSRQMHADSHVNPLEGAPLSNSQLIEKCIAENSLDEPHVKYLKTLTNTDLSYHIYPFASLIESNEVMKLLLTYLTKCPYLLSSLLAISATFQFNQTGKILHDSARQKYIMVCFNSLNGAFSHNSVLDNTEMLKSNIEKLLLTVLILSSYFTATNFILDENVLTSWKTHLRGARDLLLHYGKATSSNYQLKNQPMSGGLALAKCWFFAIESSAALHSSMGGSIARASESFMEDDDENVLQDFSRTPLDSGKLIYWESGVFDMNIHPEYHAALERVHMVCHSPTSSEFNLFWGFTSRTVRVILLYSSIMDFMRSNGHERVAMKWIVHLFKLIDECTEEIIVPGTKRKTFEIPASSPGHPEYSQTESNPRIKFPESCYVERLNDDGSKTIFSWFDASHQLHVDNFLIKIMVLRAFLSLPRSHPHVQEQLNRLFSGFFFIEKKSSGRYQADKDDIIVESDHYYLSNSTFDNRCVMIQSIFRALSTIVTKNLEFEQIELFFMGLVKLGNGSSLSSLDMVTRFKEQRYRKARNEPDVIDDEIYDYETLYDIPFA